MPAVYSPQAFAERLIAIGRFVLAAFSLLAIWLDPSTPAKFQTFTYALLTGYVLYSLVTILVVWRSRFASERATLGSHIFDLAIFSVFIHLTEGPGSPFYVYFIFSLFCAMLRFRHRGVFLTALTAMLIYIAMGVYSGVLVHNPNFELNRFIIRTVYLCVIAALMIYFSIYHHRLSLELSSLAAWPRAISGSLEAVLQDVLRSTSEVLRVPQILFVWEESEEPWVHFVHYGLGKLRITREAPTRYNPLVAEGLAGASFISEDLDQVDPVVLHPDGRVSIWKGTAVNPELRKEFGMHSALAVRLDGESVEGWLFAMGRKLLTHDDLVLGRIVGRLVTASVDQFFYIAEARQKATSEERLRLSRDLHDGLLQSLTGVALQLQAVRTQMAEDPGRAAAHLAEVQAVIEDDQSDLRAIVSQLRPQDSPQSSVAPEIGFRLGSLRERFLLGWGMNVTMSVGEGIADDRGQNVYKIVSEALANAARHGQATAATVRIESLDGSVHVVVSDNGHGFPFTGRYDLAALREMKRGPKTLKERIASLGGDLIVDSSERGSTIEAHLPKKGKELRDDDFTGAGG